MKKFNWQVFISINLFVSFIVMFVSGIVLFIKPEGSVARWIDWDFLFLSKSVWESVHTLFSFLFMLFAFIHIFRFHLLNIRNYLKIKNGYWLESFLAFLIGIFLFTGSASDSIPFSSLYQWGDKLSSGWSEQIDKEPNIDARTSLDKLVDMDSLPGDSLYSIFKKKDISLNYSLIDAARQMKLTPYELYRKIKSQGALSEDQQDPVYQNLMVEEVLILYPLTESELKSLLETKGKLDNYSPEMTFSEIGEQLDLPPEKIIQFIKEEVNE